MFHHQKLHFLFVSFLSFVLTSFVSVSSTFGYGVEIHRKLVSLALEHSLKEKLNQYYPCPKQEDLNGFLQFLSNSLQNTQDSDPLLKAKLVEALSYYQPYSSEKAISMGLKQWLMLDPYSVMQGFDSFTCTSSISLQKILEKGSVDPDLDLRNQNRLFYDRNGNAIFDKNNREIPIDPNILFMGNLRGLSSQAHAHYGLSLDQKSSDPNVLKETPHLFAIPPDVKTYSPEFTQIYLELALLAFQYRSPSSEALSYYFLGNAFHYLGDVGNQIHTVQVGLYDFFFSAKLESYKDMLFSIGGLRYQPKDFKSIGIQILKNHHTLSEEWYANKFLQKHTAIMKALGLKKPLQPFKLSLVQLLQNATTTTFGKNLTYQLIDFSSKEGSEIYSLIRELAISRISKKDGIFDETKDNPDDFIEKEHNLQSETKFFQLETLGLLRASVALSTLFTFFEQHKNIIKPKEVFDSRIQAQNNYWNEVEQKRLQYIIKQNEAVQETFSLKKFIGIIIMIGFALGWLFRGILFPKPKRSVFR